MTQSVKPIREIQTEHPINEIWSMLGYFESKFNCEKYLEDKFGSDLEGLSDTANSLSYTVGSAREFYDAADGVSVLTRPLLLFYGMIDLSKALFISTHGKKSPSRSHGLQSIKEWNGEISELSVKVSKDGTFPQFHGCYCKDSIRYKTLALKELFSQIPEIKTEFETIYNEKSRALYTSPGEYGIEIIDSELEKYGDLDYLLNQIPGFSEKYRIVNKSEERCWLINIQYRTPDLMKRSISGDKYFVLPIVKEDVLLLPEMSVHYLIMYLLGMISRYQPEEWGKVITGEDSGEIYFLKKFLYVTRRKFPNLVLNELRDREFFFVSTTMDKSENRQLSRRQLENIYDYVKRKERSELRSLGIR